MSNNVLLASLTNVSLYQGGLTLSGTSVTSNSASVFLNQTSLSSSHTNVSHNNCTLVMASGTFQASKTAIHYTNMKMTTSDLSVQHQNASESHIFSNFANSNSRASWTYSTIVFGN